MEKERRDIYRMLADEVECPLCTFCKYSGNGDCDSWDGCEHPLSNRIKFPGYDADLEPNEDCWGYRPALRFNVMIDLIGVILSSSFDEWFYRKFDDGTIKVYGKQYK